MRYLLATLFLLLLIPVFLDPSHAAPRTDCGKVVSPGQKIQDAINNPPDNNIICVKPGNYYEEIDITTPGLTVSAYDSTHKPIINGEYSKPGGTNYPSGCPSQLNGQNYSCYRWEALIDITADNSTFEGFEVIRSAGRGIRVAKDSGGITNAKILNNHIHDLRFGAIFVGGPNTTNTLIEGNDIHHVGDYAPFHRSASLLDWPAAVLPKQGTYKTTIRNNRIHENWTEGYHNGQIGGGSTLLEGNTFFDNYSTNTYIHAVSDVTFRNNLTYWTESSEFYRGGQAMPCLILATSEPQYGTAAGLKDIHVYNNLFTNCIHNLSLWMQPGGTVSNVNIHHNTFINAESVGIDLMPGSSGITFSNNIIEQSSGTPLQFDSHVNSNNNQVNQGNIIGFPSNISHNLSPNEFKLKSGVPAIDASTFSSAQLNYDYFRLTRPINSGLDIGAHEFGGKPGPTNTPLPTQPTSQWDLNNDNTIDLFDFSEFILGFSFSDFDFIDLTSFISSL